MLKLSLSSLHKRCWQPLFIFVLLLNSLTATAWDSTGHRIISTIAYDNLKPETRTIVDRLTQISDPGYSPVVRFAYTSTLPDQWRKDDRSQANWHFINYPWSVDGTATKPPQPVNLVTILEKNVAILRDPQKSDTDKATALAYVTHLVGDAHQPLHDSSRFSHAMPEGDKGGNLFPIQDPDVNNLHAYWDAIARSFVTSSSRTHYPLNGKQVKTVATRLQQRHPINSFAGKADDLSVTDWTQQGFALAQHVYDGLGPDDPIPTTYAKWASQTAQTQMALAGYRLAGVLNEALK
jgi:hypothetical protein